MPAKDLASTPEPDMLMQFSVEEPWSRQDSLLAHRIDSAVVRHGKLGIFNGAVLVAKNGKVLCNKEIGYADIRKRIPLEGNTSFQLASVSKMFTAVSILKLYEQGLLGLDDEVTRFYPDFPYQGVTIRHLLQHRSGLPRYMWVGDRHWNPDSSLSNQQMMCLMEDYGPRRYFRPNRRYNYINTNYAVLAAIVEEVSGIGFPDFVSENIFQVAGMDQSFIFREYEGLPEDISVAVGYNARRRRSVPAVGYYLNGVTGDKGCYSTVLDLHKFNRALGEGSIVPDSLVNMAFEGTRTNRRGEFYGFGFRRKQQFGHTMVYHYGWWQGFKTSYLYFPEHDIFIAVLCNKDATQSLPKPLMRLVLPKEPLT